MTWQHDFIMITAEFHYGCGVILVERNLEGCEFSVKKRDRYQVMIHCKRCGERFFLKGTMKNGIIETGFKRCLCDNESDFEIETEQMM